MTSPSYITIPLLPCAPQMTGNLLVDTGWSSALQVPLGPNSYFQIGKVAQTGGSYAVYLGLYCNEFLPGLDTRVVLGMVTKSTAPTCAWRVHYQPFPGSVPNDKFWRDLPIGPGTGWNAPGGDYDQPPAQGWPQANVQSWFAGGGSYLWTSEIMVPPSATFGNAGVWFPAVGAWWWMYVNILSGTDGSSPSVVQFPWKAGSTENGDIETSTPDVTTKWGPTKF